MGDFSLRVVARTVHRLGALYLKPHQSENAEEGVLTIKRGTSGIDSYKIISEDIDGQVKEEMETILQRIKTQLNKGSFYISEQSLRPITLAQNQAPGKAKSTESSEENGHSIDLTGLEEQEKIKIPEKITLYLRVNIDKDSETNTISLYGIYFQFFYHISNGLNNVGYENVLRGFGFQLKVIDKIIGVLNNKEKADINGMQISCIINEHTWYQLPTYQTKFPDFKWMISDPRICQLDKLPFTAFDFLTVDANEEKNNLKKIFIHYWNKNSQKNIDEKSSKVSNSPTCELQSLLDESNLSKDIADICFQKDCIFFLHVLDYKSLIERFDSNFKSSFNNMFQEDEWTPVDISKDIRRKYRDIIVASFTEFEMYYMDRSDKSKSQSKLKHLFSYFENGVKNEHKKQNAAFLLSLFFDCFDLRLSFLRGLQGKVWCQVLDRCDIYAFKNGKVGVDNQ
jgi:hypothetical protein